MTIKLHLCYKLIYDFILCLFIWNNDKNVLFPKWTVLWYTQPLQRQRWPPGSLGDQEDLLTISASWQGHTTQGLAREASSSHWAAFMYLIWAFPPHHPNTHSSRAWLSCKSLLFPGILSPGQRSSPLLLLATFNEFLFDGVWVHSKARRTKQPSEKPLLSKVLHVP